MTDFIERQGLGFFTHVLFRLNDQLLRSYEEWADEAGFQAPPRTHSTLQALAECGPMSVTELAALIRQSRQLVNVWVRQLTELGFIASERDRQDARRTVLSLTAAGRADLSASNAARVVIAQALTKLMNEADAQVYEPLWRMEKALRRQPFIERLRQEAPVQTG